MSDRLLLLTVLPFFLGCGSEADDGSTTSADDPTHDAWFREQAVERGLIFQHRSGHDSAFYFPELMGGGAALFDMDGDGDLDVFLVQSGSLAGDRPPAAQHGLFANQGDGTFKDVSAGSGIATDGYGPIPNGEISTTTVAAFPINVGGQGTTGNTPPVPLWHDIDAARDRSATI